jgi:hypothetical protein
LCIAYWPTTLPFHPGRLFVKHLLVIFIDVSPLDNPLVDIGFPRLYDHYLYRKGKRPSDGLIRDGPFRGGRVPYVTDHFSVFRLLLHVQKNNMALLNEHFLPCDKNFTQSSYFCNYVLTTALYHLLDEEKKQILFIRGSLSQSRIMHLIQTVSQDMNVTSFYNLT